MGSSYRSKGTEVLGSWNIECMWNFVRLFLKHVKQPLDPSRECACVHITDAFLACRAILPWELVLPHFLLGSQLFYELQKAVSCKGHYKLTFTPHN